MIINKQLIPILFTAFFLASCGNLPNIKISIEDNRTKEAAPEAQEETNSESEVATTTEPQPTEVISENSSNLEENEPKAITQSASGITPQQLNRRAKYFTVRIDGMQNGSGVIIDESDNTYTVLTNWHVVQEPGTYKIQTSDGREHQIDYQQVQQLSLVDLALVKFTSQQNYQVAEVGDSDYLSEGQAVHLAGYPGVKTNNDRLYRFYNLNIVGLLDTPINQGYSVLYEGETISGMSGSPLLDGEGNLVGIHGMYRVDDPTIKKGSSYAIPINTYKELVASQPESTDTIASQPSPVTTKEDTQFVDNSTTAQNKQADDIISQQENSTELNSGIQEGQFVHNGFNDQVKVEILDVKRLQNTQNPKTQEPTRDIVAVKYRIKRIEKQPSNQAIHYARAKARNVDTFEEYEATENKHTWWIHSLCPLCSSDEYTSLKDLPYSVWKEAYFWVDVPKGVEALDIVIPETKIFANVPVSTPNKQVDSSGVYSDNTTKSNSAIQEGQFINNGFDNQLKVELLKVKRIQNPETKKRDAVAVKLRVKRAVENIIEGSEGDEIYFHHSIARNLDTYEEYIVVEDQYSDRTALKKLPFNVWGDAYFWLAVPDGIKQIDIEFPYTEIFRNVPIEE